MKYIITATLISLSLVCMIETAYAEESQSKSQIVEVVKTPQTNIQREIERTKRIHKKRHGY
jgi:hypothetical protein